MQKFFQEIVWMQLVLLPSILAGNCPTVTPLPTWDNLPSEKREQWKHGFPRSVNLESLIPSDLKAIQIRLRPRDGEEVVATTLGSEVILKRFFIAILTHCFYLSFDEPPVRCLWRHFSCPDDFTGYNYIVKNSQGPVAIGNALNDITQCGQPAQTSLHRLKQSESHTHLQLEDYPKRKIEGLIEAFFLEICKRVKYEECPDVCGSRCSNIEHAQPNCIAHTNRMPNFAVYEDEFKCNCDPGFHWDQNQLRCLIGRSNTQSSHRPIQQRGEQDARLAPPDTVGDSLPVFGKIDYGLRTTATPTNSNGTSSSKTAGIVVAILVVVIIFVLILCVVCCKKKTKPEDETQLIENKQSGVNLKGSANSQHSRTSLPNSGSKMAVKQN